MEEKYVESLPEDAEAGAAGLLVLAQHSALRLRPEGDWLDWEEHQVSRVLPHPLYCTIQAPFRSEFEFVSYSCARCCHSPVACNV